MSEPDEVIASLEVAVRAARSNRRTRYEAWTVRHPTGEVLHPGPVGRKVADPDAEHPWPLWTFTLAQCEEMLAIIRGAVADAIGQT